MERAVIAGGVQVSSLSPKLQRRVPGTVDEFEDWYPATHPNSEAAPNMDMSISVGWNTAKHFGLKREELDAWAYRSHMRAIAAIDAGKFVEEIAPLKVERPDGSVVEFAVDEHPRRSSTLEKLASLKVLHPEIEGFSITAGNSSGVNDAAAAVTVTSPELAAAEGLEALAKVRAWAAVGVDPALMGLGGILSATKVLERAGLTPKDVTLWEINEAFASVPVAAVKELGLDEERVNFFGSGCSLGHPVAASGARMVTTLIHELRRRGGGIGVASMCAGGGQGGAVLIEV
jgi:acetyl-CoA acetyltransferase family protein